MKVAVNYLKSQLDECKVEDDDWIVRAPAQVSFLWHMAITRRSKAPRQQNGSDCGVYVLVWMHRLHLGYTVNADDGPPHWMVPDMVDNLDGFRLRFLADIWAQTGV